MKSTTTTTDINWPANAIAYINNLKAQCLAAEKNSARYLWLRDKANYSLNPAPMVFMCAANVEISWDDSLTGSDLDEKIDNQIKKGTKNV